MPKRFSDFQTTGMVSVWVGDFRTADELDDYLNSQFESDFGFPLYDRALQEIDVKSQPVAIERLVEGFSRSQTFATAVVEAAHRIGRTSATAMFIIYFFSFDPSQVAVSSQASLTFVGAVPFPGFT